MSTIRAARAGWWHDYVCPTHGTELDPPERDAYPCRHGCRFTGEPYAAAWLVLEHQAAARGARLRARRHLTVGSASDREQATETVRDFAAYYREVSAGGWSEHSEAWMLQGKLFSQALTEAIWAVQIADAVTCLALDEVARNALGEDVGVMLGGLLDTVSAARQILVVDRSEPASNYTAWLDAAGGSLSRALVALGRPGDVTAWVDRTLEHLSLAVLADGWEWEGSTYYHLFVLRASLLNLRGTDPAALPQDAVERLAAMVGVLASLAAPDGALPVLHDGPYDRTGMDLEVLEVCVLAGQLWRTTGLSTVEAQVRLRLGEKDDGLEDLLGGWFAGSPLPGLTPARASIHFDQAGYVVLRDPDDSWQAVLDAGPHGGSHGHLDKLGLYLYGDGVAWQPAPGVPPYASPLRHGYYARTLAHPTVRVDGADQDPTTGVVESWQPRASADHPGPHVVARADEAIAGVTLSRELLMTSRYLLDVVRAVVTDGQTREITLALRPAVPMAITAADGGWRSTWSGPPGRALHGVHRTSAPAILALVPGRGTSDDPAVVLPVGDWTAHARDVTFVSAYAPGESAVVTGIDLVGADGVVAAVRVHLATGLTIEHEVGR
ncbi:heparinase II/III domain-containing protein [Pengzhenrongella frigida]|uniref:Heparinase II/III-like C-terminal domain-containing protein n=1 Tax=Pengzhenrongella frigida TaxID=1259133 RepID=A0A4Q5N1Y0_9MICO|nr:heparinase II/III family protein [Cellulomonas sp. HLT2-17]RYV52120.1 hypothetical protein EUA98_04995 [Cellulomonas sp. HLT2-17]